MNSPPFVVTHYLIDLKILLIYEGLFWEHKLQDKKDFQQHVDYIHYNQVKNGKVTKPVDWQYSSIHRYIRNKIISHDWGNSLISLCDNIEHE